MNHFENTPSNRRRRRPFGFVGTAVTTALVVYGTYHIAMWAWNTWNPSGENNDDEDKERISNTMPSQRHNGERYQNRTTDRLQQRRRCMAQCRRQTVATLAAFSTMLRTKIEEGTDTTMVRRQLKEIRKLQSEDTKHQESILWMSIQVETVTRLITTVYATTLLFTTLTIQIHHMGGRMYNKNHTSNDTSDLDAHNALLRSYDAFWERDGGVDDLLEFVRTSVQTALKSWNIQDPTFALQMTFSHLLHAIAQIRTSVEAKGDLLHRFIIVNDDVDGTELPESAKATTTSNNELLNEMYDILESPVANDAIRDALQCTFTILQQHYIEPMFVNSDNDSSKSHVVVRPLPHVISQLKIMTNSFIYTDNSDCNSNVSTNYIKVMEQLPTMQEAARISFGSLS